MSFLDVLIRVAIITLAAVGAVASILIFLGGLMSGNIVAAVTAPAFFIVILSLFIYWVVR